MMSVLLATPGVNAGKSFGRAQPFLKPIATNGSARLATAGMGDIGRNYERVLPPLVGIWLLTSLRKNMLWCGSMDSMAPGPCSQSGRLRVCDARQRLHRVGSPTRSGSAAPAPGWRAASPRKSDDAPSLRLSERASGTRGRALSRRGCDSSGGQNEEPGGAHTPGHGLRTLLYQLASAEFHGLRCCGAVFASRGFRADSLRRRQRAGSRSLV